MPLFHTKTIASALGVNNKLTLEDRVEAYRILRKNCCIVLTYEKAKLSTWLINLSSALLRKKEGPEYGPFTHVAGNVPPALVNADFDTIFVESTSKGVHLSDIFEVSYVNAMAILYPKNCSAQLWQYACIEAVRNLGKKYDTLFNPSDEFFSCAELWVDAIKSIPNWEKLFPGIEALVQSKKNIVPMDFILCDDFYVVFNVRR